MGNVSGVVILDTIMSMEVLPFLQLQASMAL